MKQLILLQPVSESERGVYTTLKLAFGKLYDLVQLTKPEIMLLVVLTGATALVMQGDFVHLPLKFVLVLIGLELAGGSANALNQYLERDIDARMSRTRRKRPLPLGKITPTEALLFAVGIGVVAVV